MQSGSSPPPTRPRRGDLERATDLFRLFREQPTPELAESARLGLAQSLSPNERLQRAYHPWTSYVIVPLFALANAGVEISTEFLARSRYLPHHSGRRRRLRAGQADRHRWHRMARQPADSRAAADPVGWAALAGTGAIAGIGFTVSLLIASLAFHGPELEEAKLGILSAAMLASLLPG